MKLIKKHQDFFFIVSLIVLFSFTYLYKLEEIFIGIHGDEAAEGYHAYTLIKSCTDEYCNNYPVLFSPFGDYKNPVFVYSNTPSILLSGLNEFSIRFTSIFFSVFSVIILFYLGNNPTVKKKCFLWVFYFRKND